MKYILYLSFLSSVLACKAQVTTVNAHLATDYGNDNVYYKDMDNDLNRFIGTWKYTQDNTSLLIILEKKVNKHIDDIFSNYYVDAVVGEYQYIENGVEKVNTLANLTIDYEDPYDYNINGDFFTKSGDPGCNDCGEDSVKVYCSYFEPECYRPGLTPVMALRHFTENDIEKLECKFYVTGMPLQRKIGTTEACSGYAIPLGVYVLEKQQ